MKKYPILMQKPRIAKLFISRAEGRGKKPIGGFIDIGMTFDDGRYVEYEFEEQADQLTYWLSRRIMGLFGSYRFDGATEVCILDQMSKKDPFFVYIDMLSQQIGFDYFTTDKDQIVRRVAKFVTHPLLRKKTKYIRKSSQLSIKHLQPVWKYIVKKNRCPWITPQYDASLVEKSHGLKIRKQILRLGMYYMYQKEYTRKFELNRADKKIDNQ